MATKTAEPFKNIAVSLSGGGYRATAFHLGALSYLDSLQYQGQNLLQRVNVLSTISGGTLTGVMFALYLAKGRSFANCYKKLYDLLKEDKLLEQALNKLNHPKDWRDPTKSINLINAFSEVYNEFFFEDENFGVLFADDTSHLKDVIFGATEFTTGIQFRFTENDDKGKFGNGHLNLPDDVAAQVRLGDAAAASSCFPGGFEPLAMPNDFSNGHENPIAAKWKEKGYPPTGIMDGGIIDNQGIEGVQLAEKRRSRSKDEPHIGTYIISDVSPQSMIPYEMPTIKYSSVKNFFTLISVNIIVGFVMAGAVAALVFIPDLGTLVTSLLSCLITLGVVWFAFFLFIRFALMKVLYDMIGRPSSSQIFDNFNILFKTPIYILAYLARLRATSVIKMVSDVFLRRIRNLQLTALFSDRKWNYRITTNNIYTLQDPKAEKSLKRIFNIPDDQSPVITPEMAEVIETANSMPTTLWFTDKEKKDKMLEKLIACGQFTLCFNLLSYIEQLQKGSTKTKVWDFLSPTTQTEILDLHKKLKADFQQFLKKPLQLVDGGR